MRYLCIGCEALARPLYRSAADSPHLIDFSLLPRGLHNTPARLRARLQELIDAADPALYQAVLLGYGLCGQATAGLRAASLPLILPRCHDCITLFLGSRAAYDSQFNTCPGTFWYTLDYIEREDDSTATLSLGAGSDTTLNGVYEEYVQKYGRDNADYLMEVMGAWQQHYRRAAFVDLGVGDPAAVIARAQAEAERRGWAFERIPGDLILFRRLLHGDWGVGDDFVIVPPGQRLLMSSGPDILKVE